MNTNAIRHEQSAAEVRSSTYTNAPSIIKITPSAIDIALKVIFLVCFIILATSYKVSAHTLAKAVKTDKVCTAIASIVCA